VSEQQETARHRDEIDRAQLFEELRFAKKQQWTIAAAAVTLLAAIFALQHSLPEAAPLKPCEKIALAVVITLIATFCCNFLIMLQKYMRDTRLRLEPKDRDAAIRGVSVAGVLVGVVVLSAFGVLYFVALR
jgi:hypothetical protein